MEAMNLNNDTKIPAVGFGLWQVKNERECIDSVQWALADGYRHFDTAQIYGNEAYLGKALKSTDIARGELFITTKIWNENQPVLRLDASFDRSLENLQTDYVDMLLLHFPVTETRRAAWRELEKIAKSGRAQAIGVSNYTVRHLEELLGECDIKPAVNQVELHVYLQQPELVEFCKKHDIVIEAYSPLAHGYGLDNSVLAELGTKYGKSPAQIMLRWCIDLGTVPLPKSVHEDRIKSNVDLFDFQLTADDMAQLATLDKNHRTCWDPTDVE